MKIVFVWNSRKSLILSEMWDPKQLFLRRNTKRQLKHFRFQKDPFLPGLGIPRYWIWDTTRRLLRLNVLLELPKSWTWVTLGKKCCMEQNYCWMLGEKAERLCGSLNKGQESYKGIVYKGADMVLSDGDLHPLLLCGHFPRALCLERSYGKWG